MKKVLFLMAASATVLLAACTSESGGPSSNISYDVLKAAENANVQTPITFETFSAREAVTRVGTIGSKLDLANHYGFGVFAYYTNAAYSEAAKPNFMFNQQVTAVGTGTAPTMTNVTGWEYSPIKYWPNETKKDSEGTTYDISTNKAMLSFFAYAPYVPMNIIRATDGVVLDAPGGSPKTVGITKITPKDGDTAGEVKIDYVAGTSKNADELLFGIAETNTVWNSVDGATKTINAGETFKDLVKPANNTTIKFYFKHALSRLGMTVVAARNEVNPTTPATSVLYDATAKNKTKIFIEKITINRNIHVSGTLNLNNTTAGEPKWEDTVGAPFVINESHAMDPDLAYPSDPLTFATLFASRAGVTTTEKSVMGTHPVDPADPTGPQYDDYYLLLPETAATAPLTTDIIVEYHVVTEDANLPGGYSDVKNTITKTMPAQLVLEKAKSYNIRMIIGVNSVDLDMDVQPWTVDGTQTVYVPKNND